MRLTLQLPRSGAAAAPHPFAGVCAGALAGLVYLVAQMAFAGAMQGDAWAPLERIAAILLGPDAVSAGAPTDQAVYGIGVFVHFSVAVVYGRIVDLVVRGAPIGAAALLGAAVGVAAYLVDFHVFAPLAFPWFADAPQLITLADHALFGLVAGVTYAVLRRQWSA